MDKQIKKILEKCIILLEKGYSVRYCLSKYSKHRKILKDYLQNLEDLNKIIPLELEEDYLKDNLNRIYERLDSEVKEHKSKTQYRKPVILRPAIIFLSIFLVLIFSFSGVIHASKSSVPGNTLYPVKRSIEEFKLKTYPESIMGRLHYQLLISRMNESIVLLDNPDSDDLIIGDLLEEIDNEFLQCRNYHYFGNKTEDEVLVIIRAIKNKYIRRLGESEEESEDDSEKNYEEDEEKNLEPSNDTDSSYERHPNANEELPQDVIGEEIDEETEEYGENESDFETDAEEEDSELGDEENNHGDDIEDDGSEIDGDEEPDEESDIEESEDEEEPEEEDDEDD